MKMPDQTSALEKAIELLRTLLERPCDKSIFDVVLTDFEHGSGSGIIDADAVLEYGQFKFVVEYKSSSYSAHILRSIQQLKSYLAHVDGDLIPLVLVPFMGNTGEALCRKSGVSWLDLSGNATIKAGNLLVKVKGEPNKYIRRGRPSSVFSPKSARLARWMLINPGRACRQSELSDLLDVSPSLVNKVVKRLLEEGYCEEDEKGQILAIDLQRMLDDWKAVYKFSNHRVFKGTCPASSGSKLMQRVSPVLEQSAIRHVFTGFAAAWQLTKHAMFRNTVVYVEKLPDRSLLDELDFQEGDAGANLWFVVPDDIGVFHGNSVIDDIRCVHPVQAYLDLSGMPGRSEEAAEELYKRYIRLNDSWKKNQVS